jgi:SAM-dependent methyltransferase
MEAPDFKKIAGQLRNPSGKDGLETANRMEENNAGMIRACIDQLSLRDYSHVLEIGFGGGGHLPYLLQQAQQLRYQGVDISQTMTDQAVAINQEAVKTGQVTFQTVLPQNGYVTFPFEADTFDHIFTVNTLYFWDNAPAQASEILRVLKPGGLFIVAFATEEFMKGLPFTQYDFHLYSPENAQALLEETGFTVKDMTEKVETVMSNGGPLMERSFILLSVGK